MSIGRFALRHRSAILFATLLLGAAGGYALFTLPAGIYPEVVFPRIVILARAGTFEPREMVVAVTRPIEEGLTGIVDLRRIRSRTVRGGAELNLDFRPGADMPFALQQVQARLATLQGSLPAGLETTAERLTPSVFPMVQFELTGTDPIRLRELADFTVRPHWARIPDVAEVEVQGGLVREIAVVLDPSRLVSHHISATEVAERIRGGNLIDAVGRIDRDYQQRSVLVSAAARNAAAVGEVVVRRDGVAPLRVSDLGKIRYDGADRFDLVAGNGVPAALINVSRQPGGSMLAVQRAVLASADSIRALLPQGVRLQLVYDQAALVRASLVSVAEAMLIGAALSALVLWLFLRRPGIALLAALSLPITVLVTFGGMALTGESLNLMSLGGLAVAIGLIIDDAVVVVENLQRRVAGPGTTPLSTIIVEAIDEIVAPVAGSTLTTIVVFAPLSLVEGAVGQFFRSFSLALSIAVALSFLLAVLFLPALASRPGWLVAHSESDSHKGGRIDAIRAWFGRTSGRAVTKPWWSGAIAVLLAIAALGFWQFIGTGFLPEMDEGGFVLDYWTPTGTSLSETDRQLHTVEQLLREDPDVAAFTRRTGSELGLFATAPNTGDLTVLLRPKGERKASVYEIMDRLRVRVEAEVPAVRVEFTQVLQDLLGDLTGAPSPVEVKLFHPDVRVAEAAAKRVGAALEGTPGLKDLFDGVVGDVPTLSIGLNRDQVSRLGLDPQSVAAQARTSLFGEEAGSVREADRLIPITVRVGDSTRFKEEAVRALPIVAQAGWAPLGTLGTVWDSSDVSELRRENLRPMVSVTGSVDPEQSTLGNVDKAIRAKLKGMTLPAGVTLEYGGQVNSQREAFRQLMTVLLLAMSSVLLVMVAQFGSLRAAIAILVAACLALTGALGGLAVTGVPFNVSSFMGLILLTGLVVKNGIILFDAALHQHRAGLSTVDALTAAASLRVRPIVMTTLCTLGGLAPLALGVGAAAELQRPLAVAVIGGLTLSTAVTLFLLPAGLAWCGALERAR